ncbi:uncharacterized protein LOC133147121 [Syngnathus typhle]|uniref:uncharacterized protein LOC133147121 n=1 Tax=Syngnathus typhle TaxID=161592 RepID=UPI002A69D91B|nr:uncharacterized protein LOC133147121 [Syngnathus typhle]
MPLEQCLAKVRDGCKSWEAFIWVFVICGFIIAWAMCYMRIGPVYIKHASPDSPPEVSTVTDVPDVFSLEEYYKHCLADDDSGHSRNGSFGYRHCPWNNVASRRHRRDISSIRRKILSLSKICTPALVHDGIPCVPWRLADTYLNSLAFTVAPNTTSTITVPLKSLRGIRGGYLTTGDKWPGHWWYLTGNPEVSDWSALITSQVPGFWPPGSSEEAQFFAKRMTLKNQGSSLLLTVTLPDDTVRPPHATLFNTSCWGFQLWAWSSGKDPQFPIVICVNKTMRGADSPVLSDHTKASGVVVTSVALINTDSHFVASTGISGQTNNWLLMAEQAANMTNTSCVVCMGPRPLLKIIPASVVPECAIFLMLTPSIPSAHPCSSWDKVYPVSYLTKSKPLFSTDVAKGNFTCVKLPGTGISLGVLPAPMCTSLFDVATSFSPIARSDIWFWCNTDKLYDSLPLNSSGTCALVTLLLPVLLMPATPRELDVFVDSFVPQSWSRAKRSAEWQGVADPTYIDAIGVPRGVPDEYKLVDQIAAGFESSICWWCTLNKNVDRINYIHYNVQRLGNWTEAGFRAVHSQLAATSLMAFQNRMALDMLLAKEGGVCAMIGEQCCTFIPNNTAAGGSLSLALEGLRTLNGKMKDHSGVTTEVWNSWLNVFGKYRSLVSSVLVSLAVFSAVLTLCGCCCIPCLRSLINKLIATAISPAAETFPLLPVDDFELPQPLKCHPSVDSIYETPAVDLSDFFPESDVV